MPNYLGLLQEKYRTYGPEFDPSLLHRSFIRYYEMGWRLVVDFGNGVIKRGWIGVDRGPRPTFVLLLTRRSWISKWKIKGKETVLQVVKPPRIRG